MPHICPILSQHDRMAINALSQHKMAIRRAFAETYGYDLEAVAVIPRLLTALEVDLSENILQLELVIDTGDRESRFTDGDAVAFKEELFTRCPSLAQLHFGVWLREPRSNGFAEHRPAPQVVLRERSIHDLGGPA